MTDQSQAWLAQDLWAPTERYEKNPVSQLLVPAGTLTLQSGADQLFVSSRHGEWPAYRPADEAPDALALQVQADAPVDAAVTAGIWTGQPAISSIAAVRQSLEGSLSYAAERPDGPPALRLPQLGALHSVLGYWTTGRRQPATVVMPTGTGKTETMLALFVAAQLPRLLVLVPSDALREQIAGKFERLGVLQELGIVSPRALRPSVGRVQHRFTTPETARAFAERCNVIVATPAVLRAMPPAARQALLEVCSHLFVDEAHHQPAASWHEVLEAFAGRPVVQFTATPFREDGRHLGGRIIYAFPLRKAQEEGYFAPVNYHSVLEFEDTDRALAIRAVTQLRADLAAGLDHLLMVRVRSVDRMLQVLPLYEDVAADLSPVLINSGMSKSSQREALGAMRSRQSRVIVCVNMLGEGFDLPALKVAAVHDPQRSLGVTLQFIGRFARAAAASNLGEASVFVARKEIEVDKRLRTLYAEDADWNTVLRDLSETAVEEQEEVSDFEAGFTSQPENVTLRNLIPKLSAVVYRAPTTDWRPEALVDFFGEDNLLTMPIGLNPEAGVAWCIVEHENPVRFGPLRTIEEKSYELFVLYFDARRRLLYINSSSNSGLFQELADAVLGEGSERFTNETVWRVMADITRLTPTTIGVLDAVSRFRRFSMHVGADVKEGYSTAESSTKVQTNISASGFREGVPVNISASRKGRIWSHAAAPTLKHWCDWCDAVGTRLLDRSISLDTILRNFLIPEPVTARPAAVLLGLEWPWEVYTTLTDQQQLVLDDTGYAIRDVGLRSTDFGTEGPFRFAVKTPAWSVEYEASVADGTLTYRPRTGRDAEVVNARGARRNLSDWLNQFGLTLLLSGDRIIDTQGLLLAPDRDREPYRRDDLQILDWHDTNLRVESQGSERRPDSIQARMVRELQAEGHWSVILDDDGPNEVADLVAFRLTDDELVVRLVHCKYAHGAPGARVSDLYEVCGQAQKCVIWHRHDSLALFKHLERRARRRNRRTGVSPFETGDLRTLYDLQSQALRLRRRFEIVIVQPGLSASGASRQQLDLLAAAETYLGETAAASLRVICSA